MQLRGSKRARRLSALVLAVLLAAATAFTYLAYTAAFTPTDNPPTPTPRACPSLMLPAAPTAEACPTFPASKPAVRGTAPRSWSPTTLTCPTNPTLSCPSTLRRRRSFSSTAPTPNETTTDASQPRPFDGIVASATAAASGAQAAGINLVDKRKLVPQALHGDAPPVLDSLQHRMGSGPSIDASRDQQPSRSLTCARKTGGPGSWTARSNSVSCRCCACPFGRRPNARLVESLCE